MKKVLFFFLPIFLISLSANAAVTPVADVASTSYVAGAYDTLDSAKQDKLSTSNVTTAGNNGFMADVSASNGLAFTKNEISIPVGAETSNVRAGIWIQ